MRWGLREAARRSHERFATTTGFRLGGHVPEFVAQDVVARARYWTNRSQRLAEQSAAASADSTEACFAFSRAHFGFGPVQHFSEIDSLLELSRGNGSQTVCEIGAQDAGTSVLFSRVLRPELLLVMDLYMKNRWRLRRAAPEGQSVRIVDGDSSHPLTLSRVRRKLAGRQIDLLLIDGDHRWEGVRSDFLNYREFVRDGGLIAFHDICDVKEPSSGAWAGDVPEFWQVVSRRYPRWEFVDTPGQSGLGIGVIRYSSGVDVSAIENATADR